MSRILYFLPRMRGRKKNIETIHRHASIWQQEADARRCHGIMACNGPISDPHLHEGCMLLPLLLALSFEKAYDN